MSSWNTVALQDVATIERNIVEASAIDDGTLYVGLENIKSGGDFVDVREVDSGELASSKFAFTPQHLLYGKLRPYLAKIARPSSADMQHGHFARVTGPNLDRDYLLTFYCGLTVLRWPVHAQLGQTCPSNSASLGETRIHFRPA